LGTRNPGKENCGTGKRKLRNPEPGRSKYRNRELDTLNAKLRLARFSEHGSKHPEA
jgi:hypothetical protein